MKQFLFSPRVLILGVLAAMMTAAMPAGASAYGYYDTTGCVEGMFSQAFSGYKDSNWYTLVSGQSTSGFNGAGWTLSGGAKIVSTKLPDGSTGTVLDMPSGSTAVSPRQCVMFNYPTARTYVRDVRGAEGVDFSVSYEGSHTWEAPKSTGQIHGQKTEWTAANPVNLAPEHKIEGWQPMRITLSAKGTTSEFQVYNLYLDPRLSR